MGELAPSVKRVRSEPPPTAAAAHVRKSQPAAPSCNGAVAVPSRQAAKGAQRPCAVAVPPSLDTTRTSCTQADAGWVHSFRDQVAAELFPHWRTRANRIAECGRGALVIECKPCGAPHMVPVRCGSRTCPTCARKAARAVAERVGARVAVHDLVMESTPWDGPGKPQRRSWRMLTLTTPALPNIEDRFDPKEQRRQVKRARAAWGAFWRSTAWGRQTRSAGDRRKRSRKDTSYALGMESSPRGVIHLHVAVYGEYISQKTLQALWGDALGTKAPVVDVRTIKGAAGVGDALKEVLKYATKGEKGPRQAAHAAAVEVGFRNVRRVEVGGALRTIQLPETEAGGSEDVKPEDLHNDRAAACQACGTVGEWRWVQLVGRVAVELNGGFGLVQDAGYVHAPPGNGNCFL